MSREVAVPRDGEGCSCWDTGRQLVDGGRLRPRCMYRGRCEGGSVRKARSVRSQSVLGIDLSRRRHRQRATTHTHTHTPNCKLIDAQNVGEHCPPNGRDAALIADGHGIGPPGYRHQNRPSQDKASRLPTDARQLRTAVRYTHRSLVATPRTGEHWHRPQGVPPATATHTTNEAAEKTKCKLIDGKHGGEAVRHIERPQRCNSTDATTIQRNDHSERR